MIILINTAYALLGGILTLVFMWLGYKLFDTMTPFNVADELQKGNRAVGAMVMGLLIGIGTAMGLVIGLSLN